MTKTLRRAGWFLALALVAACVTVNIYFPAATVEKTADQIVSDVYGEKPPEPENGAPGEPKPSSEARTRPALASRLADLIERIGPAEAQAELIDRARDRKLLDKLKTRQAALHAKAENLAEQKEFDEMSSLRFRHQDISAL